VQVNDDQGTAVPGALVEFHGPRASALIRPRCSPIPADRQPLRSLWAPSRGDTSSAQSHPASRSPASLDIMETALGYQQRLGSILADKYCNRCHDPESSPERVSNYDNLEVKPHPIHRRQYAEQDERCRSDFDHSARRPGAESLGTDAALRKYPERGGCAGSYRVYSRSGRSPVSAGRDGLCAQVELERPPGRSQAPSGWEHKPAAEMKESA
jgi:hypothetical protein